MQSQRTNRSEGQNQTGLIKFLLVVFIIGFHTKLSIYSGTTVIFPLYLCILPAAAVAYICRNSISNVSIKYIIYTLALVMAVMLVNGLFGLYSTSLLTGTLHFCASFFLSVFLILGIRRLENEEARRFFITLWVVFAVLAGLELIPALRTFFSDVTSAIYFGTPRSIYGAGMRDMELYGRFRPRAFATEPSFLSATLSVLSLLTLFAGLRTSKSPVKPLGLFALMMAVSYLMAPSLSVVFYFLAVATWLAWPRTPVAKILVVLTLSAVAFAIPLMQEASGSLFGVQQSSGSYFGRVTAGPLVALKAFAERPFLGYGIGNSDAANDLVVDVWLAHGGFSAFPWFQGANATVLMANGFWWQWIYLGVAGGAVLSVLLVQLLKSLGVKYPVRALVCTWIVWYVGAAFETLISWVIFSIFAYADWSVRNKKGA